MFTTGQRLDLQALLEQLLGSTNVYFQPPAAKTLEYPAIVYQWDQTDVQHADDIPYRRTRRYQVTVIDRNPDSVIPELVGQLRLCSHTRFFTANNLNHHIFTLYY